MPWTHTFVCPASGGTPTTDAPWAGDLARQVAVLREASALGLPFCASARRAGVAVRLAGVRLDVPAPAEAAGRRGAPVHVALLGVRLDVPAPAPAAARGERVAPGASVVPAVSRVALAAVRLETPPLAAPPRVRLAALSLDVLVVGGAS